MLVRFWGTRGSLPKPGPDTIRYGGNTSCIEIRSSAGTLLVLDCGSGAHGLGRSLADGNEQPVRGHLLISHTHWDHIQGIPFFTPLFVPDNEWDIYAPNSLNQSIRETLAGQMQYTYFPVTIDALGAKIKYHDLVEGAFEIDDIRIVTQYLHHPALTLGYRIEVDGQSVVYACDHEPFPRQAGSVELNEQDLLHVEFLRDADLVIHDAQYTEEEYPIKVGWGHSPAEYAVDVCAAANVKQLALTHHDPMRNDDAVDQVVSAMRTRISDAKLPLQVFAAAEGQKIELKPVSGKVRKRSTTEFSAVTEVKSALAKFTLLLGPTESDATNIIDSASAAENVVLLKSENAEAALKILEEQRPSLIIVDEHDSADNALRIGAKAKELGLQAPIVVLTHNNDEKSPLFNFKTERIIWPFSVEYARTRLRAWILRTTCRWVRAQLPANEEERLAALKELAILDTEPEERFDHITRLAVETLDAPVALVSLVDRDRQWFKSCIGTDIREAPRDMAFCAHAILENDVLIVPDTFLDARFADNPMVTGESRVRFYAGCPLRLPDGNIMGTLCLVDIRPREFDDKQLAQLRSLARMVEKELAADEVEQS